MIKEEEVFFVEYRMLSLDHLVVVEIVGVAKDVVSAGIGLSGNVLISLPDVCWEAGLRSVTRKGGRHRVGKMYEVYRDNIYFKVLLLRCAFVPISVNY